MGKKRLILAGLIGITAVACVRKPVAIPPPVKADIQLSRVATPIEVVPASADLEPGTSRLFFARIITPGDRTFRYDANLFRWRVQEADGGTVTPNKKSQLYYTYTAPQKPGYYHLLVELKDTPTIQAIVSVKVGHPDETAKPEVALDRRRPNGAGLPE